jgi:hypothetical protein
MRDHLASCCSAPKAPLDAVGCPQTITPRLASVLARSTAAFVSSHEDKLVIDPFNFVVVLIRRFCHFQGQQNPVFLRFDISNILIRRLELCSPVLQSGACGSFW